MAYCALIEIFDIELCYVIFIYIYNYIVVYSIGTDPHNISFCCVLRCQAFEQE